VHVSMERSQADSARFVEQDLEFHQTLFRISGNRVCNMMFTVVHQSVRKLMALTATLVDPEHTLAEARQRMIEHLEDATGLLARTAAKQTETRLLSRLSKLGGAGGAGDSPANRFSEVALFPHDLLQIPARRQTPRNRLTQGALL